MKKYLSLILTFSMLLAIAIPAFAEIGENKYAEDLECSAQDYISEYPEFLDEEEGVIRTATASHDNAIIIVPGVCGSELYYGSTKVWAPTLGSINSSVEKLSLNENGVPEYRLTPNNNYYGVADTYKELYTWLKRD